MQWSNIFTPQHICTYSNTQTVEKCIPMGQILSQKVLPNMCWMITRFRLGVGFWSDKYDIANIIIKICHYIASRTHFVLLWKRVYFTQSIRQSTNYANPAYGVATICHQVRWLRWGHPSLFHTATSLLIWCKMFCVRDISYRLIWMEFINMFSVHALSGTHNRFNW